MKTILNASVTPQGMTVTLLDDGAVVTEVIASTHPRFVDIVKHAKALNAEEMYEAISLNASVKSRLDEFKAIIERDYPFITITEDGQLFVHDLPAPEYVADKLFEMFSERGVGEVAYVSFVKFLDKLFKNPSMRARNELVRFLESNDIFTLTEDGNFIAYKGCEKVGDGDEAYGISIHSGYGIVNGRVFKDSQLENKVGYVLQVPRERVDDDAGVGCSFGLHVGSYNYAERFARGILLTVEVSPEHVVSVPFDCANQKVRVCEYKVIEVTEKEYKTVTGFFGDEELDMEEMSDALYCALVRHLEFSHQYELDGDVSISLDGKSNALRYEFFSDDCHHSGWVNAAIDWDGEIQASVTIHLYDNNEDYAHKRFETFQGGDVESIAENIAEAIVYDD